MKPLCVYHSADLDGICSGAIVKHFVPDVELVGFDYGQAFPWEKVFRVTNYENIARVEPEHRRTVYMCDVSLPPADMKRLAEVSNLIWIDHHASAWRDLSQLDCVKVYHPKKAACELVWGYFEPNKCPGATAEGAYTPALCTCHVPEVVRLLGRYDVFDKDNPEWEKILAYQYGFRTHRGAYDPNDSWYSFLFGGALTDMGREAEINYTIGIGRAILRYQAEVNRRACETGAHEFKMAIPRTEHTPTGMMTPDGYARVLACNTIVFNSQFFDGFYDPEKHDVMCAYCQLADGRWKVSLYSTKPEIDCGAICKTFGGGGHVGAAGFICDKLPWEK